MADDQASGFGLGDLLDDVLGGLALSWIGDSFTWPESLNQ